VFRGAQLANGVRLENLIVAKLGTLSSDILVSQGSHALGMQRSGSTWKLDAAPADLSAGWWASWQPAVLVRAPENEGRAAQRLVTLQY
jgi:hypothetical protein